MTRSHENKAIGVALRAGAYILLVLGCLFVFSSILSLSGSYLIASAAGVFLAAAAANAIVMRVFERAHLTNVGLGWNPASVRNLLIGLAGGAGAAAVILLGPIMLGLASFQKAPGTEFHWYNFLFVSVVLLFGAAGEEMMFRGYAFQVLLAVLGPLATILPFGVIFGLAHSMNLNISMLALVNTALWGILFGVAFLRSGDLWLPIGLHFGWNWALPLFGVNLSGFTMSVTGYSMQWRIGSLWSGGDYGPEGSILTSTVLILLALLVWKGPVIRQPAFLLQPRAEE